MFNEETTVNSIVTEETTVNPMITEETEMIATYVSVFFRILSSLVDLLRAMYSFFFED